MTVMLTAVPAVASVAPSRLLGTASQAAVLQSSPSLPEGFRAVAADGGVFDFGTNRYLGSLPGEHMVPAAPVAGMAPTRDGLGYWLVGSDGGVFAFGDAHFFGSLGSDRLDAPIVGMAATPDGKGYWLVGSDGGVFAFGDAHFFGSLGGRQLAAPIVAVASAFTGTGSTGQLGGYWLVARDGGVFSFGAPYLGSLPGQGVHVSDVIGLTPTVDNQGYWIARSDGTVYPFGSAPFLGDFQTQAAAEGDPGAVLNRPWTALSTVASPGAAASSNVTQATLSFSQQPSTVQQGTTSSPHYMCPPVTVSATDGPGGPGIPNVAITLNYSGSANPGLYYDGQNVTSTGVTVETGPNGQATFGSCTGGTASAGFGASNLGSGYTLTANSPVAVRAVTSQAFSVVQVKETCTAGCSTGTFQSSSTGTTASIQTNGSGTYDLIASFGLGPLECDSQVSTSPADPVVVQTTPVSSGASDDALVTLTFPKSVVDSVPVGTVSVRDDDEVPPMSVCAGATAYFPGSKLYPQDAYQYQGLLGNCPSGYTSDAAQLCIVSEKAAAGGGESVTIYVGSAYTSDPSFW